jgi:hypothetical protein
MTAELTVFRANPAAWSARMRRAVLQLPPEDVALILEKLELILRNPDEVAEPYLERVESSRR